MNRRVVIIIAVLAVVIVGAVVALAVSRTPVAQEAAPTPTASTPAPPESEPGEPTAPAETQPTASAGEYVDYSETAIANAAGTPILFFHAPWCIQCKTVEEDILHNGLPDGVTVIKVDYDSNQELRQKYGVTLQTTFVRVDASGEKVESFVAYDDPRVQAVTDALL
ncbi:thiol-disulfide isomerase/thioredoxin [Leifsonia sp. AK011]|uniref:thioredoxin domain-containing protein n=1 Tax=Leifsonia sp. AK011 TaxID=2723075 RepID=UPI0015C99283|nr:thioredoxin domain-containing protein [Leifsonia sp. AK011]NYF11420.1 thiol-disulfide isomerase/thioredoxin [Leifsonia sp. AK011]